MKNIVIKTSKKSEIINITEKVEKYVPGNGSGVCIIHVKHTTCALTTADLDPGTDQDHLRAFREMIPDLDYNHPHDPSHVGDHIMSSIIGNSVSVPFEEGELLLGTWQNIVLVELNGPREREIVLTIVKNDEDCC